MAASEHEADIMEGLVHKKPQTFWLYLKNLMAFKIANTDVFFCQQAVFRLVLAELEHRRIFEFWVLCHVIISS